MSGPFPTMICNEPPPLDSEDEDSESFRDFPSAGLKLDILCEPSPQQSPIKSPLKKTVTENGLEIVKERSSEADQSSNSPLHGEVKNILVENGLHDNVDPSPQLPIQSSMDKPLVKSGTEENVEESSQSPTDQLSPSLNNSNDLIENVVDQWPSKQPSLEFSFPSEDIISTSLDNDIEPSPQQSPFQSPIKGLPENHVDLETDASENSSVQFSLNDELFENCLDANIESSPHQTPNQSPWEECTVEKYQEEDTTSIENSTQFISESVAVTLSKDHDLEPAQDACAQPAVDEVEDDFGDFEAFQSSINTTAVNSNDETLANNNVKTSYIGTMEIDDDEFGNFEEATFVPMQNSPYVNPTVPEMSCQNQVETLSLNNNESFGDFENFQSSSLSFADNFKAVPPKVSGEIENKLEVLVKSVFKSSEGLSEPENKAIELLGKNLNEEWTYVQDFEGSHGLQFKWANCAAHQRMLHSLKIDTTAVMYTGKWGTIEVPRFAASIVESPLQPKVYSNAVGDELLSSMPATQSAHETASSRENVTKSQKSQSGRRGQGSSEAQQILDQLPDLSFMRAKTLVFASQIQE